MNTVLIKSIYLAWEEWGFTTSYFLSVNLVIEQCAHEIMALSLPVFISWRAHRWLEPQDNLHFSIQRTLAKFAKDVSKRGKVQQ